MNLFYRCHLHCLLSFYFTLNQLFYFYIVAIAIGAFAICTSLASHMIAVNVHFAFFVSQF